MARMSPARVVGLPNPEVSVTDAVYRNAFEAAALPMGIVDLEGNFVKVNRAFANLLGYSIPELEGKCFQDITHPDDVQANVDMDVSTLAGERSGFSLQKRYVNAEGTILWVHLTVSLARDADGTPEYFISQVTDVTQEREAELRKLRRSTEKYFDLYDNSPNLMCSVDPADGTILECNKTLVARLGYDHKQELVGKSIFSVYHPDCHRAVQDAFHQFQATGEVHSADLLLRSKSGEQLEVVLNVSARKDESGKILASRSVWTDITELNRIKRLNEALALRTEELEALALRHSMSLRASGIGVWDWDVLQNHLVWDPQMYRIYRVREEDFSSAYEAWSDVLHPDDRAVGNRLQQQARDGQNELEAEFRILWPNGEVRNIRVIAVVTRDDEGQVARMVGVNWDVTIDQRRIADLERLNTELEQFTSFASHDLKAPIRHITFFASMLEESLKLEGEQREWLDSIIRGTAKMQSMVDDLLALSRAGNADLERHELELGPVFERIAKMLQADQERSLQLQIDGTLPTVRANANQLEHVIQNLLENAIRYAKPQQQPRVEVRARQTPSHWIVAVCDNGIGIAQKHQKTIFEPFRRVCTDTKGSGIGLAICAKVIARHGGELRVHSQLGEGATFEFSLSKACEASRPVADL